MDRHILDEISFNINPGSLSKYVHIKENTPYFETLKKMVRDAEKIAKPKALYRGLYVDTNGEDEVTIGKTKFNSRILKVNLENIHRVFLFAATCGREIDKWAISMTDMLQCFIVDAIKTVIVHKAILAIDKHIQNYYKIFKVSRMTPGSLKDWPITEQRNIFSLLGDVEGAIGVRLLESMMMSPAQSVSGLIFPTETSFESCQLCPRENCIGRRAVYDKNLYAVEDRTPRVYPWMNEPGGGIIPPWNTQKQLIVYIFFSTTWFGFSNTAAGS